MPPNRSARSIAARKREARKRGSIDPEEAAQLAADPTYLHDSWQFDFDTPNGFPEASTSVFAVLDDIPDNPLPEDALGSQFLAFNNWQHLEPVPVSVNSRETVKEEDAASTSESLGRNVSVEVNAMDVDADLLPINEVSRFMVTNYVAFTDYLLSHAQPSNSIKRTIAICDSIALQGPVRQQSDARSKA